MTEKCVSCGKFIPYADMECKLASFHFVPSNHFGPEVSEWTCADCTQKESLHREEWLATAGVLDR